MHESSSVNARRKPACFLVLALGFSTLSSTARRQHPGALPRNDHGHQAHQFSLLGPPIELKDQVGMSADEQQAEESQWLRGAFNFQSVMSFNLRDESGKHLYTPRLAVLSYVRPSGKEAGKQRLRIFKAENGKLVSDFSLDLVDPPFDWEEIRSFPSDDRMSGIVIWGGSEVSHNVAKVVAYVGGKFQVVFDKAYDMELIDLDFDGIPEVISGDFPTGDGGSPTFFQVWTWAGEKYVPVAHVPIDQVFSPDVIRAVKAVKRTRPGKAIVPSRPEGLKR